MSDVTVTEVARSFAEYVNRVAFRRESFILLRGKKPLAVDLACARAHAQLWADLRRNGTLIGPHDLWLAATCIAHGLTMVTGTVREFARAPGLELEVWEG